MAFDQQPASPRILTYEDYLAEGETLYRYDIVDGVRDIMPNPSRRSERVAGNVFEAFRRYQRSADKGKAIIAPCDILVTRAPLRTRQPDVLFISHDQLRMCGDPLDPAPLLAAPEIVVEIVSPSETGRIREAKIADYCAIGVQECWVVDLVAESVRVLRLTLDTAETIAVYAADQVVQSVLYSDLRLPIADIFAS